ncbi:MAG: hypothetical protein IKF78_13435 [Atopobiaceae bacterium]|nr:hypothetical protein [Atopobiaceae bacterium]
MNDIRHKDRPEYNANCAESPTRKIDANDLHQYCHYNGEDTMVIVLDAVMDRDVDGDALGEAVRQAEKRFSSFGCGLSSAGRGLCYKPLVTPARAYKDVPGKRWLLGTDDTAGRLYRVAYAGPRITVSLHHGLRDGRGAFEYLKALICFYLAEFGYSVDLEGKVLVAGDVQANEDEYPCSKYGEPNDKGSVGPARGTAVWQRGNLHGGEAQRAQKSGLSGYERRHRQFAKRSLATRASSVLLHTFL